MSFYITHCNTLQRTATHYMQHTASHCNTLQHTAPHCNTHVFFYWRDVGALWNFDMWVLFDWYVESGTLAQYKRDVRVAVWCSVLRCVALWCSVLHVVCCSVLHILICREWHSCANGGDETYNNYDSQNFQQVFTGVPVHVKHVFLGVSKHLNWFSRDQTESLSLSRVTRKTGISGDLNI